MRCVRGYALWAEREERPVLGDADPSKWDCPPHTKAKHQMLSRYLGGWYPILSSWNGRVVFLDGFAGRGRYNDGSEGSPLIALRCLLDHRTFSQMRHREFVFCFIEANYENAQSLEREIDAFKAARAPWPESVRAYVINDKFDVTANAMLGYLREQKRNLAPTFAFIDPFGYSGLPMDVLADLLSYPRTEVFLNFMVGHVQRFIKRDRQESAMRSLFGIDVHEILDGYNGQADRVRYLRSVYDRQLRERVGFDYVQSFGMINDTDNIGYYLFHGTRHRQGVKLMKDAMWKVDPGGGFLFSDRLADQDVLFTPEPDLRPLRDHLLRYFTGQRGVPVESLEWHTILYTPYRETHVRPILRKLEADRIVRVNRPPGKRQFTTGVTIDFP
jgi:three-Cys-motif partner protein